MRVYINNDIDFAFALTSLSSPTSTPSLLSPLWLPIGSKHSSNHDSFEQTIQLQSILRRLILPPLVVSLFLS